VLPGVEDQQRNRPLADVAFTLQTGRRGLERRWERNVMDTMADLHGRTLALVGAGNIGRHVAQLARAYGIRVVACRRTAKPTPFVDRVYPLEELHALLAEGDFVGVAVPLTAVLLAPFGFVYLLAAWGWRSITD